jgi:hypothetical protein
MDERFDSGLGAHVVRDDTGRVREIRHTQEFWASEEGSPLATAIAYLREMAAVYEVPPAELASLHVRATHMDPEQRGVEYRLAEETQTFDAATFGFDQTYLNTPVWGAGLKVMVKLGPNRVIRSVDTSHVGIETELPPEKVIERYKRLFATTEVLRARRDRGDEPSEAEGADGSKLIVDTVGVKRPSGRARGAAAQPERVEAARLIRGRFWIYQYDEADRLPSTGKPVARVNRRQPGVATAGETRPESAPLTLPLPPVADTIRDGNHYLVAEITFEAPTEGRDHITWQALVELTTESVLYLRALSGDADGRVFLQDPPTKTGGTAVTSASNNATLDPHATTLSLPNLDPPSGAGVQSLIGTFGRLSNVEGENIAPPTLPSSGSTFVFQPRTNDFAAVSAYYHVDLIFRTIADLGFTVAGATGYFNNTTFPISVDHRCFTGDVINAHCVGNGVGGIGHVGYGIMDTTDTANPLGRACDPRVTWHELCGHGILYEFVNSANFGFSHSAGDSLAGIFYDPESNLWGVDGTPLGKPGDLRFTYVPWHPTLNRRYDRAVSAGWAWGGSQDDAGYGSEEILATTLFRVYRSIGGDSSDLGRRKFASRMMMFLILRTVQNLTQASNPQYARDFASEMMAVDQLNWTSEGIFGGAYKKVIRWSFEKQGEYQSPLITNGGPGDGTITTAGKPPDQDVYIDDGRAGEYQYQPVHWHTTTIWNRRANDGGTTHEEPELGSSNYAYVKIKNRGTQNASNIVVRGFHTKPGAGLLWPTDFEAFTTAQINAGSVGPNNSEEKVVGPFEWTPNLNAYGHDCMLIVVSASGDASNVDNFTAGEVIPEWRLVPNDNNVGQRNVQPVAAGGGTEGLLESLDGLSFWVGNPNPRRATIGLKVQLPAVLGRAGWRLAFESLEGNRFALKSGERREVVMRLHAGKAFTRDAVEADPDRDITVSVFADDNLMGGMTYRLDPAISRPHNAKRRKKPDCREPATALLECLGIPDQDVKSARIKQVIVGIRMRDDDCC